MCEVRERQSVLCICPLMLYLMMLSNMEGPFRHCHC